MDSLTVYDTAEQANSALRDHEKKTYTQYIVVKTDKEIDLKKRHQIRWTASVKSRAGSVDIPFTGVPFIVGKGVTRACKHGPDLKLRMKAKRKEEIEKDELSDCPSGIKRRRPQPTQKFDCPAVAHIKEVIFFPQYKVDDNRQYLRDQMSAKLRETLCKHTCDCEISRRYYLVLFDKHENHVIGQEISLSELPELEEAAYTCREKLKALTSYIYQIENVGFLTKLNKTLDGLLKDCHSQTSKEQKSKRKATMSTSTKKVKRGHKKQVKKKPQTCDVLWAESAHHMPVLQSELSVEEL